MKSISIDSNSILDMSTKKPMSEVFDFNKEYVTTETDKDTTYKAGEGVSISSDNTISLASVEDEPAIEQADSTTAGIMKLYSSTGSNTDGTMTQESITDELSSKAPTASPTFTGTPTAPTPSSSDTGSDRIATTAYVLSLLKNDPTIIDDILTALNGKVGSANPTFTGTTTFKNSDKTVGQITAESSGLTISDGQFAGGYLNFYINPDSTTKGNIELVGAAFHPPGTTGQLRQAGISIESDGTVTIRGLGLYYWDGTGSFSSKRQKIFPTT